MSVGWKLKIVLFDKNTVLSKSGMRPADQIATSSSQLYGMRRMLPVGRWSVCGSQGVGAGKNNETSVVMPAAIISMSKGVLCTSECVRTAVTPGNKVMRCWSTPLGVAPCVLPGRKFG
ncbi:hypothetical protein D6789_00585 [Candidatus Woesearchaeota archaeon]|nr:MAG: hypothetical protein D6789_00585 [Candidatus Woesearchaeota archaeon]